MLVNIPIYGGAAAMLTEAEVIDAAREVLVGKARAELMKLNHARLRVEAAIFENHDRDEARDTDEGVPERADYYAALTSSLAEFEMVVVALGKIVKGITELRTPRAAAVTE